MARLKLETLRQIVEEEVFTIPEAAEYLGMTRQNVHKQAILGKIPCVRGKLFLRADLDEYDAGVRKSYPRKGSVKNEATREE
jgi:hypothetical protein